MCDARRRDARRRDARRRDARRRDARRRDARRRDSALFDGFQSDTKLKPVSDTKNFQECPVLYLKNIELYSCWIFA